MPLIPNLPTITVLGQRGHVFAGEFKGTLCFVPETALVAGKLDPVAYQKSNWQTHNVRLNPGKSVGSHLFPRLDQPLTDKIAIEDFVKHVHETF